jgi:hypothetical protein
MVSPPIDRRVALLLLLLLLLLCTPQSRVEADITAMGFLSKRYKLL